jgi:ABC-type uncharacterized transport system ATPase subunit
MSGILLQMSGVSKTFGAVAACRDLSLFVEAGEIHALLGENGAGKTTLMNILYGMYHPDRGRILWKGSDVQIDSTRTAIQLGIGMVHQHFMLVPTFTVVENVVLGLHQPLEPLLDLKGAARRLEELSRTYGLAVDPGALVWQLPVGVQQRVEILKALYRNVSLLILDEPTAVLTPGEVNDFFQVLAKLKETGVAVILITHKLDEVMAVADRVTVLRQGRMVSTGPAASTTPQTLAEQMVGTAVPQRGKAAAVSTGEFVLEVNQLVADDERGLTALEDVNLSVAAGEILGVAGVDGNGQRELAEVVTGLRRVRSGTIRLLGQIVTGATPGFMRNLGVAHIPQDRQSTGLVLDFSTCENMVLGQLRRSRVSWGGFVSWARAERHARDLISTHAVHPSDPWLPTRALSGGNQQKVIVARELGSGPKLLVAVQPTRGLDIGAAAALHRRMRDHRNSGGATLLISTELDEICEMSDRIAVLYRGRVMGILPAAQADRSRLGLMMAGTRPA